MTITTDSPIVGNGGTVDEAVRAVDTDVDTRAYIRELYRLCDLVGFDFRILFAQAWHETAGFTSTWWTERLNPAGIGITGDQAQDAASHTWATGTDAARAHVAHMWAYVHGTGYPFLYEHDDPRFQAVFDAGYAETVRTLGDLGNGKWATERAMSPTYADDIAALANQIFEDRS